MYEVEYLGPTLQAEARPSAGLRKSQIAPQLTCLLCQFLPLLSTLHNGEECRCIISCQHEHAVCLRDHRDWNHANQVHGYERPPWPFETIGFVKLFLEVLEAAISVSRCGMCSCVRVTPLQRARVEAQFRPSPLGSERALSCLGRFNGSCKESTCCLAIPAVCCRVLCVLHAPAP